MPHCTINSTKSYKRQGATFAVPLLMVLFRKEAKGGVGRIQLQSSDTLSETHY